MSLSEMKDTDTLPMFLTYIGLYIPGRSHFSQVSRGFLAFTKPFEGNEHFGQVLAATLGSPSAGLRYHGSDLSTKLKMLGVPWAQRGIAWEDRPKIIDLSQGSHGDPMDR